MTEVNPVYDVRFNSFRNVYGQCLIKMGIDFLIVLKIGPLFKRTKDFG